MACIVCEDRDACWPGCVRSVWQAIAHICLEIASPVGIRDDAARRALLAVEMIGKERFAITSN